MQLCMFWLRTFEHTNETLQMRNTLQLDEGGSVFNPEIGKYEFQLFRFKLATEIQQYSIHTK